MKKNELIRLIKNAVRDELQNSLPKILNETLHDTKIKKEIISDDCNKLKVSKKQTQQKLYTKNPVLNKVLNETVGGVPTESNNISDNEIKDLNGNAVNIDNLPKPLANALTRDYTELLNVVEKKKAIKS
tara:strand:+ start:112 stop:498 length:387 start_codon:yes stop_codon:yes gene_type:complete